jgi:hypothetical protein
MSKLNGLWPMEKTAIGTRNNMLCDLPQWTLELLATAVHEILISLHARKFVSS